MKDAVIQWLATGETGISSKSLAFDYLGVENNNVRHPLDTADLNRCLKLIAKAPDVRASVDSLALKNEGWAKAAAVWDEIGAAFIKEVGFGWSNAKSAPFTYKLMKDAGL